ncbi:hypothetical protein V8E53_007721 [Lactarius tabidus]
MSSSMVAELMLWARVSVEAEAWLFVVLGLEWHCGDIIAGAGGHPGQRGVGERFGAPAYWARDTWKAAARRKFGSSANLSLPWQLTEDEEEKVLLWQGCEGRDRQDKQQDNEMEGKQPVAIKRVKQRGEKCESRKLCANRVRECGLEGESGVARVNPKPETGPVGAALQIQRLGQEVLRATTATQFKCFQLVTGFSLYYFIFVNYLSSLEFTNILDCT